MSDADRPSERTDDPSTEDFPPLDALRQIVAERSAQGRSDPAEPPPDGGRARAEHRRGVRYGLALACVVAAVYLSLQWQPAELISLWRTAPGAAVRSPFILVLAVVLLAGGFLLAPTSPLRSMPAALLALVLVPLSGILSLLRFTGPTLPGPFWLWSLLTPGTVALGVAILGWLVVRERPFFTVVLALGALLPSIMHLVMFRAGVSPQFFWMTDLLLSTIVGAGAAWIAAGIAVMMRPSRGSMR